MKLSIVSIFLAASLGSLPMSQVSADTTVSAAVQDVKTRFYEIFGKDTVTVAFVSGSSVLSENERKNLMAAVAALRNDSRLSSAIVAAWSDKEYPATKGQHLSKSDNHLADARNSVIKKSLSSLGVKSIETHTMAQHPSWIGKLFNTDDAKMKGEGVVNDSHDQLINEMGQVLRDKGGPGKAVVILRRSGEQAAN